MGELNSLLEGSPDSLSLGGEDPLSESGSMDSLDSTSLDSGFGEDLSGMPGGEEDMSALLGESSFGGDETGLMDSSSLDSESPSQEEDNPCSCLRYITPCHVSENFVTLPFEQRTGEFTTMFADICGQLPGGCSFLDQPEQLLFCSEFEKLDVTLTQYYELNGESGQSCDWAGMASVSPVGQPSGICAPLLEAMHLNPLGSGQGMDSAMLPGDIGAESGLEIPSGEQMGDPLAAGGEDPFGDLAGDLPMEGDDFALGSDMPLGDESALGGDMLASGELGDDFTGGEPMPDDLPGGDALVMGEDPMGMPSEELSGLGGELPQDEGALSGESLASERPQLAENVVKQKRDWRGRRAQLH